MTLITQKNVEHVLATPAMTTAVVVAAARALNALYAADLAGKTRDGDDVTMVVRNGLQHAFIDFAALTELLEECGTDG